GQIKIIQEAMAGKTMVDRVAIEVVQVEQQPGAAFGAKAIQELGLTHVRIIKGHEIRTVLDQERFLSAPHHVARAPNSQIEQVAVERRHQREARYRWAMPFGDRDKSQMLAYPMRAPA